MSDHIARRVLIAFALTTYLFLLVPQIDLWITDLVYENGVFFLRDWAPAQTYREIVLLPIYNLVPILFAVFVLKAVFAKWAALVNLKSALFLLLTLLIGPGLIVNGILKELWGRARPDETTLFGGHLEFQAPWVISAQCPSNCSFTSGEAAAGMWLIALVLLLPRELRPLGWAVALILAVFAGIVRVIQGQHYTSDVIFSGFIVYFTVWAVHRWMYRTDSDWITAEGIERRLERWHATLVPNSRWRAQTR